MSGGNMNSARRSRCVVSAGRLRRGVGRGHDDESGQIMLLTSAFVAFALLLVAVVVTATGIHLDRKQLFDLADNLALDAADSMTEETFYSGDIGEPAAGAVLVLTDGEVRAAVDDYLHAHPEVTEGLRDVTVVDASTPDGRTARVILAARAEPKWLSRVTQAASGGIIVRAESSARAW